MSKQPGVMFTEPNEFVAEISRDHTRGLVERGIVRVTVGGLARPASAFDTASSNLQRCSADEEETFAGPPLAERRRRGRQVRSARADIKKCVAHTQRCVYRLRNTPQRSS